jgi:hypothetical protein
MKGLRSPYHPGHIPLGLVLWSLWFVALYSGLSVACALVPPAPQQGPWNWLNALLGASALLTTAALTALAIWSWRAGKRVRQQPRERFVARLSAGTYGVAAVSTLVIALPILSLPPCL